MGFRNMTIAPSSLYSVHEPLIDHIKNGVVTCIEGGSARGKVGRAVSGVDGPSHGHSLHGGRVRAIEWGDLHIDAAFIGAPCADAIGNCNGVKGPSACGPLSYALADAIYSEKTVAVTDYMEETRSSPSAYPRSSWDGRQGRQHRRSVQDRIQYPASDRTR